MRYIDELYYYYCFRGFPKEMRHHDAILLLVIVLTRAAPALQYHFVLFFFFLVGLVVYSCVIFLLCCYGIVAQYFGFSNFGSQNTTSVQNVVLRSAWDVFFCCNLQLQPVISFL